VYPYKAILKYIHTLFFLLHTFHTLMHTPTFLQKVRPFRLSWQSILPLLTLLVGLGTTTGVRAQTTISFRSVVVTSGTTASNGKTVEYNATSPYNGPNPNVFDGTDFGSIDLSTGQLLLQGGSIQVVEAPDETYPTAFITYGVKQGADLTTTGAGNIPALTNTLQLDQVAYDASTRTRTFSFNTAAARNILALATTGGAGTNYRFDISVSTGNGQNADGDIINPILGPRRKSVFTATGTAIIPPTIKANTITIAPNGGAPAASTGGADVLYNISPSGTRPFQGADLSSSANSGTSYDVNSGQLRLAATTVTTTQNGPNNITSVVLYYRTRVAGTSGGAYQPITLTQSGLTAADGTKTFILDPSAGTSINPQPNLIATPAVTAAGDYVFDVYYQANGINSNTGTSFSLIDPANSSYSANFTVTGKSIASTIWTGAINDNWFDPANWSAGVPTATTDAQIRDLGAGNSVPYPNINADTKVTTAAGTLLYDNTGSGPALVRNLTMGGTSQASRSIARLVVGRLKVYGNFSNEYDSYIQRENTVTEFAGGNQDITGGTFVRVDISGGGLKNLVGIMTVSESLNFLTDNNTNAGILRTDITKPTTSVVVLNDRSAVNGNNGAQLNGETELSYLYGFARTTRAAVLVGEKRTYSNLGMTLTFTGDNNPGSVEVTRNTVEAYSPLSTNYSIRRIFGVRPSDPQTNTGGLVADMVFHYRDGDTKDLNGPYTFSAGTGSIPESRLTIFVSTNSGNTFSLVGRDGPVDEVNNLVTRTGVRTFATFTLGDELRPLPVVLTAFNATRSGLNTQVTWSTASEKNSAGFDVQVSTDGAYFRKLAFVKSQNGDVTKAQNYSYLDTEANKSGVRYYRLRQVDNDGREEFSPVRAVSFNGVAEGLATALSAYPNPYGTSDAVKLAVQTTSVGTARLRISDLMGREVANQTFTTVNGVTEVALDQAAGLSAGSYVAQVTLPSGEVKTVRIQKR
jgi:hypothetical protein